MEGPKYASQALVDIAWEAGALGRAFREAEAITKAREAREAIMLTSELTAKQAEQLHETHEQKRAPSYGELWDRDLPTFKLGKGKSYLRGRVGAWNNHAKVNAITMMPCNHVTEDMATIFINTLPLDEDGKKKMKQTFKRLSRRAIKAGHLHHCAFEDVKIAKDRTTEDEIKFFHPTDEYPLILEHARDEDAEEFFGFSMGAGPRPGEAKQFEWSDVDMDNRRLTFRYGSSEDRATKGGRPETVPMLDEAYKWLKRRIDRLHDGVKPDSGVIFSKKNGKPYARNYDFGLTQTLKDAGIKKDGRGLYAFRHGFCVAAANGFLGEHWSRSEAKVVMRHRNEKTTDTYYRLLTPVLAEKALRSVALSDAAAFERRKPAELPLNKEGATRHGIAPWEAR
jgi:integrase